MQIVMTKYHHLQCNFEIVIVCEPSEAEWQIALQIVITNYQQVGEQRSHKTSL